MTYFAADDKLWSSPQWQSLPASARALWSTAGMWSSDQLTDGVVPAMMLPTLKGRRDDAERLVSAGLWERVRLASTPEGTSDVPPTTLPSYVVDTSQARSTQARGVVYRFVKWSDTNMTRAAIEQRRASETARKRAYREGRAVSGPGGTDTGHPPDATPDRSGTSRARVPLTPNPDPQPPPPYPRPAAVTDSQRPPAHPEPPPDGATDFVADDPAIAGAAKRWQRTPRLVANEANEISQRLAIEHGADIAHEIVRQALVDTSTRSLRRLDTTRVPGYLADLARAAKGEMRHEQGRPRGRPVELPACDHCGARKGAPEHERTLTDLDGRLLGRCTECLPGTAA